MTNMPLLPDQEVFDRAAAVLRGGGLVAFPTETVYGLGGDATSDAAVARIFAAKGRPQFNPLISHVTDLDMARELGVFSPMAERLAAAFWPGPLTLVLPRADGCPVSHLACAGLETIALRVPGNPIAQTLIRRAGVPLAAPSANPSGGISPTTAAHVADGLGGRVDMILDGGACDLGLESTVVALADTVPRLLRPGTLTRAQLEQVCGPLAGAMADTLQAPGMLKSHYAPDAALRLNATDIMPGEAVLAFGPDVPPHEGAMANLSPTGNLLEAAANLFAMLRRLDASGAKKIAAMPIPQSDIGEAINDRLQRAAAPRAAPVL